MKALWTIPLLVIVLSFSVNAQYESHGLNAKTLRQAHFQFNPKKVVEFHIERDSLGNEFTAWRKETELEKGKVSSYLMIDEQHKYLEDYHWRKMKGKIKLVRFDSIYHVETANALGFSPENSERNHSGTTLMIFNRKGRIVRQNLYNIQGEKAYTYNKFGDLTHAFSIFSGDTTHVTFWDIQYNRKRDLISSKVYEQDEMTQYFRVFYDKLKKEEYQINYVNEQPVSYTRTILKYHSNHQLHAKIVEESIKGVDKEALCVYIYNNKGDLLSQRGTRFTPDGLNFASWRYIYEYDEKGNWIERVTYLKENNDMEFSWIQKDIRDFEY